MLIDTVVMLSSATCKGGELFISKCNKSRLIRIMAKGSSIVMFYLYRRVVILQLYIE